MRASVVLLLAAVLSSPAYALHQESPGALRLTSGPAHQTSSGTAWGNWIAFVSTEDLAGIGAARVPGPQVFVFNIAYYDCAQGTTLPTTPCPPAGTPFLIQASNGVGAPANPSVSKPPSGSTNERDVWVAFDALGSYNANAGAPAARRQVFMRHLSTSELVQVTAAGDGDSTHPSLSGIAGVVVFESTAMLAGFPNPSGASQVYLFERTTNVMRQLSLGPGPASVVPQGPSRSAIPNEGGGGIAFESSADILGSGADTGVPQIFWADYDRTTHVSTLRQLTDGNGASRNPVVGDTPRAVVFDSLATDLPGTSGEPGRQVYRIAVTDPQSPIVEHVTATSLFGNCSDPALDPDGTRVAFVCDGDPLQNATAGARLFVLDQTTTVLYQITGLGTVTGRPAGNLGQWFVAFATSSDLTATGACTTQIHVVDYFAGHWAAASLLGQFPADVTPENACGGNCTTPADCDDGNPCNGVETCGPNGLCVHGTPVVCSDGNACNGVETCNAATGTCVPGTPLACNNGNPCDGVETCAPATGCRPGTPIVCGDGNACNGAETCNPATGTCVPGTSLVCNDGNPCTDDACVPAQGCVFTSNTAPCDDGDACTLGDACSGGSCRGVPLSCPTCQHCDPSSAACVLGPRTTCDGAAAGMRSTLRMRKAPVATGDAFVWKWKRPGAAPGAFGDPLTSDDYALCMYDGAGGLVLRSDAPAGATCGAASCWRAKAGSGFLYRDPAGVPTGLARLLLKAKLGGGTKLAAKGRGANLALPSPSSIALPLRAQLQATGDACWEAIYDGPAVLQQDATQLKAKLP
ncbi:MAG TPA: hypothetical protein VMS22_08120 [Candidatus Eisenbacteria bacterium]|nr:hypothetical protein [Candidatus Eisenbacteria bacterium]